MASPWDHDPVFSQRPPWYVNDCPTESNRLRLQGKDFSRKAKRKKKSLSERAERKKNVATRDKQTTTSMKMGNEEI